MFTQNEYKHWHNKLYKNFLLNLSKPFCIPVSAKWYQHESRKWERKNFVDLHSTDWQIVHYRQLDLIFIKTLITDVVITGWQCSWLKILDTNGSSNPSQKQTKKTTNLSVISKSKKNLPSREVCRSIGTQRENKRKRRNPEKLWWWNQLYLERFPKAWKRY